MELQGAKLHNANLKGANLQRAYLRHVNLRDTVSIYAPMPVCLHNVLQLNVIVIGPVWKLED